MQTISDLKEQSVTDTPLIVFNCVLSNGQTESWCTHRITAGGTTYAARVIQHSAFDIQTASDQGIDGSPQLSILLANADSHFSEIERSVGWKGAKLTAGVLFYDLPNNAALTDISVVFQGICNPPDRSDESTFRLTALNRMSLQRVFLPEVQIERRCPWQFPATAAQQAEAVDGGSNGKYSLYYRCGYSAGLPGGMGNLNGTVPYTSCGYTRSDCQARGMFTRFGGLEFIPPAIRVRSYGKGWSTSAVSTNQALYNDFVPMLYGTVWQQPIVTFARNDGNLTRMEVLLGIGPILGVLTVLVNDVQIAVGVSGTNMTGTGWYNVESLGTRDGMLDPNFTDSTGAPAGDPYGSMAYLSVVVPNQLNNGTSLPDVEVLVQGLLVPVYAADGTYISDQFSSNPAWILLDVLRRAGWSETEIDLTSFAAAAAYCDEPIAASDINGNAITLPRFQCNLLLQNRRSAGDVVRGVRNCSRMYLTYGAGGVLQAKIENTIALESPELPAWSNSTEQLNGGWPSYEFGDGSDGPSGIARKANGASSVIVTSRSIANTPNSMSVEFQDSLNGYQQDSYEMVDPDDIALTGQTTSAVLMALGLPQFDQASRILKFNLDKSIQGNTYVEFQTSIKTLGVSPGDLITVTYLKEGFLRQPFRVLRLSPATNYRTTTITAQLHDDAWYADTNGQPTSASGQAAGSNSGVGLPNPLPGSIVDSNGMVEFGIVETATTNSDGSVQANVTVSFIAPATVTRSGPGTPLVNLSPTVQSGGSLRGGETLYYAVSAVDANGNESAPSFIVTAIIPADGSSVTLRGLSFQAATTAFNVYRGTSPADLMRIATAQAIATSFTDGGRATQLVPPPDPNFDHANFYWRSELQPEVAVTTHAPTMLGNTTLQMPINGYAGMTVRITRGTGAGQERSVTANDATTLTVPKWDLEPDATSFFTVSEAAWHFAALGESSPIQFAIPNRTGEVVQITGRSANVNNLECSPQLSIVTRWTTGGSGAADTQVPPQPFFLLGPEVSGGGMVLSGVSFTDLTNTSGISAGTLTLYYWNELQSVPAMLLTDGIGATDAVLTVTTDGAAPIGTMLQIDGEILNVTAVTNNGSQYTVTRGVNGSSAVAHTAGTAVYQLASQTTIVPFPPGFFGSPYSGTWSYSIALPDVRVGSAELFVTNELGNSPTTGVCLTHNQDNGMRTLSGGQYTIQVEGFLAVDQNVAPAIVVETARSVRDVFAILGTAADAEVQVQVNVNGTAYCELSLPAGQLSSNSVPGSALPFLPAMAQITAAVLSVGQINTGANLTVVIRL
ncbi:MAG TPA: phage tail protein [Bryobacteraceae bacterium]|nr:phage tail protein [Bryobacteraceae bacterium]